MKIINDKILADYICKKYNCRVFIYEEQKVHYAYSTGINSYVVTNGTTGEITILEEWYEYYIVS